VSCFCEFFVTQFLFLTIFLCFCFAIVNLQHGGDLVANYPYDGLDNGMETTGNYSICPDDTTFKSVSYAYSSKNGPMLANPEFPYGVRCFLLFKQKNG